MKFRCASSATRELSIGKVQCGLQSTKIVSFLVACQVDIEGLEFYKRQKGDTQVTKWTA